MTYIDPNRLRGDISFSLRKDGVPRDEADRVAENFYRTLLTDHPDWFKPETVDLADFVEARLEHASYGGRGVESIEEIVRYFRSNHEDHEKHPRDDVDKGYYAQSYRDLYAIAKMWAHHPDFKKIPSAVPFVQA